MDAPPASANWLGDGRIASTCCLKAGTLYGADSHASSAFSSDSAATMINAHRSRTEVIFDGVMGRNPKVSGTCKPLPLLCPRRTGMMYPAPANILGALA
jgi:hypothetical protein